MSSLPDYTVPLVLLKTYHHMKHDTTPSQQILRREDMLGKESPKQFETACGKRIKKAELGKIKSENFQLYQHFIAYCLPEQVDAVAAQMAEMVRVDLTKTITYLESLLAATQGGHVVLDKDQYTEFTYQISHKRKPVNP